MRLSRIEDLWRRFRRAVRRRGAGGIPRIVWTFLTNTRLGNRLATPRVHGRTVQAKETPRHSRIYKVALPAGYPARSVEVRLSVPAFPAHPQLEFVEHAVDAQGRASDLLIVAMRGGFGVSHDFGRTLTYVMVDSIRDKRVVNVTFLGDGEYLLQATMRIPDPTGPRAVEVLVVNEAGEVLACNRLAGSLWHGCRSVGIADGVLMYAEYPPEAVDAAAAERQSSRVWRSRDRGRSWHIVFEAGDIRHFHFLQPRPGRKGEWWLTSGDAALESRIWVTKDDGESWHDVTAAYGTPIAIGGVQYPKSLFRLTDLAWWDDDAIWGTDDFLAAIKGDVPGSRMFRSPCGETLLPEPVGRSKWQIRSMTDVGDFLVVMTQGCVRPNATMQEKMPGVFLMPKEAHEPPLVHLFDVDVHSRTRTGFTYSRASRAAKDGTFYTFRGETDAFPGGHKLLKWEVRFS